MLFSQIFPPSPSPTESIRLFLYISVFFAVSNNCFWVSILKGWPQFFMGAFCLWNLKGFKFRELDIQLILIEALSR